MEEHRPPPCPEEVSSAGRGQPASWGCCLSDDVPRCHQRHSHLWPGPFWWVTPQGSSAVLADNHDIISLKLYQLTVERTPEEERRDKEVYLPVVDNLKLPGMEAPLEPMSGLALFLIVFFSLVAIVFAIVIGVIVYNKWQEQSRKHFY